MFLAKGDQGFESFASEVYYIKPSQKEYDYRDSSFQPRRMQWSNQKLYDKPSASRHVKLNKSNHPRSSSGVKG